MQQTSKELLLFSFDHELNAEEQTRLDAALVESEVLQQEKEQLTQMRSLVSNLRVRRDNNFSARVAARIKKEKKRGFWSDIVAISPKVAAACTALMIAALLGVYIREGSFSKEFIIGVENLTPEDAAIGIENEKITKNRTDKAMEMPKEKKRDSDNGRLH